MAIDVSALSSGLRSGTAVYVYRLVEAFGTMPGPIEARLLYNGMPGEGARLTESLERPHIRAVCAWLRWRPLPAPVFWRPYPRKLAAVLEEVDLFHVGEFVFPNPRPGLAVVATVHDVTTKLFPRWHGYPNRILHHRRLRWVRRHATRLLIDAEATRSDTSSVIGLPPERFDVVPLAAGTRGAPGSPAEPVTRAALARFGIADEPYVLYVGTLEPRKNLARLVRAFLGHDSGSARIRLVLAGGWGWRSSELRALIGRDEARSRVIVTGPVDERTLGALYAGATVFAYPSLYEGFGLPVLEAMAAGVPVITSRGGSLEELAGGAALLVDPHDVAGIAEALALLLHSPGERERLASLGRAREREFTWARTATQTLETYRRAIAEVS